MGMPSRHDSEDIWEIWWCLDGWHRVAAMYAAHACTRQRKAHMLSESLSPKGTHAAAGTMCSQQTPCHRANFCRVEKMLPPWAKLCRIDPSRPLHAQVSAARVLIPTTGIVDAAAIAAPSDLRLIAQPAAGYANIDVEAARARGVPVTIAPGEIGRHTSLSTGLRQG